MDGNFDITLPIGIKGEKCFIAWMEDKYPKHTIKKADTKEYDFKVIKGSLTHYVEIKTDRRTANTDNIFAEIRIENYDGSESPGWANYIPLSIWLAYIIWADKPELTLLMMKMSDFKKCIDEYIKPNMPEKKIKSNKDGKTWFSYGIPIPMAKLDDIATYYKIKNIYYKEAPDVL